jgi:hypothetical protein
MKYEKLPHIDGKAIPHRHVKRYFAESAGNCVPGPPPTTGKAMMLIAKAWAGQ